MNESIDLKTLCGLIARHALTAVGGSLVAKGVISASMVEPTIGAIITIGGVIWSYLQKKKAL